MGWKLNLMLRIWIYCTGTDKLRAELGYIYHESPLRNKTKNSSKKDIMGPPYGYIPGMAYRALLSSWLARNVTASVWDLWDCQTQHTPTVTQLLTQTLMDSHSQVLPQWWLCHPTSFSLIALYVKMIMSVFNTNSTGFTTSLKEEEINSEIYFYRLPVQQICLIVSVT